MTSYALTDYAFLGGSSSRVGYDKGNKAVRAVRYKFTTPGEGASKFTFTKGSIGLAEGAEVALRFVISTDPNLYDTLTADFDGHGAVAMSGNNNTYYTATITVENMILLPNTEYYLYIFPDTTTMGLYSWNYATSNTAAIEGAAGVVRIREGDNELIAVPMVKEGGTLVQLSATVKSNGTLRICV